MVRLNLLFTFFSSFKAEKKLVSHRKFLFIPGLNSSDTRNSTLFPSDADASSDDHEEDESGGDHAQEDEDEEDEVFSSGEEILNEIIGGVEPSGDSGGNETEAKDGVDVLEEEEDYDDVDEEEEQFLEKTQELDRLKHHGEEILVGYHFLVKISEF